MSFSLEKEMVAPVRAWLLTNHPLVKQEFRLPWGYCDLVGCALNPARARQRLQLRQSQPIGPLVRVGILWQVADGSSGETTTLNQLTAVYDQHLDRNRLAKELRILEHRNFIRRDGSDGYRRLNGWFPLHQSLVAVELKLARVQEAIRQARAHLSFADKSFVALPLSLAKRVGEGRRKKEFLTKGVGLLGVNTGGCKVLIDSKGSQDKDAVLQTHCAERFWRSYLRDS